VNICLADTDMKLFASCFDVIARRVHSAWTLPVSLPNWRSASRRFFTFVLLMFLLHSMGIGMFRCIASLCRDETISSTGGSFFFLALLLLGGFLLARRALHLQPAHRSL